MDDGKPTVNMEEQATSENCCICWEALNEVNHVKEMPHCKHMFHAHCIDTWLARNASCPLCRRFAMLPAENALDYLLRIWEISGINIPITVPENEDDDDGPYVSIDDLFMEDHER